MEPITGTDRISKQRWKLVRKSFLLCYDLDAQMF